MHSGEGQTVTPINQSWPKLMQDDLLMRCRINK